MGWLSVLLCAVPIYLFWKSASFILMTLAALNALLNFWSYGVMHNYAVKASATKIKQLHEGLALEGRLDAKQQAALDRISLRVDLDSVPNWLSSINMITTAVGLIGLIAALVSK